MAKKIRNKQMDLMKKMKEAKKQNQDDDDEGDGGAATPASMTAADSKRMTAEEIKERNDRLRFEELLKRESANPNYTSDSYLTKDQEEEEINAARK